jgi:DNA-directed RNA polymerase subunit RPC12/RpoP
VFDTLKAFFFSLYGAFVFPVLFIGSMLCLFVYGFAGLGYPCGAIATLAIVLYRRERSAQKALSKGDLQIDSVRQQKAINDLVEIMPRHFDYEWLLGGGLQWDCSYCGRRNQIKNVKGKTLKCMHCGAPVKLKALFE